MKKSLLTLSLGLAVALGLSAADYYGFKYTATEALVPFIKDTSKCTVWTCAPDGETVTNDRLLIWFTPKYGVVTFDAEGTASWEGSFFKDGKSDICASVAKAASNAADLNGVCITDVEYADGIWYVTIPDKINAYGTETTYTDKGTVVFHFLFDSAPQRINDIPTNPWNAYFAGDGHVCNGVYVGIYAPAGCTANAYFTTPSAKSSSISDPVESPSRTGMRTLCFDLPATEKDGYSELTSGAPYGEKLTLTKVTYNDKNWYEGYAVKYWDVAINGVKAGDRVGFCGIQTLHEGYTPVSMHNTSGIVDVAADNANAPVEYYNVQGMRVNADAPGLYIRRQGTEVTKVLIK